jgi:hypothetical protein
MHHILAYIRALEALLPAPLAPRVTPAAPHPERQTGGPEAANSRAPQARGQGMGSMPMSRHAPPVPGAEPAAASSPAQGIVTRMGRDPEGLGGEAIEPGPRNAGMRPAALLPLCWGNAGACDAARPCIAPCRDADAGACARTRSAGAGAGAAPAQAIPDGNHGDNKKRGTAQ